MLTIFLVISYLIYGYKTLDFPDFYTVEDKFYEISTVLFHMFFLFPAIVGLIYAIKKRKETMIIPLSYVLYFLLSIFSYSSFFWTNDPLGTGLIFLMGLLYSLILGVFMLVFTLKTGKN